MRFSVESAALNQVLKRIDPVVDDKPLVSIHGAVKIEVVGDRMVLSTLSPAVNTEVHLMGVDAPGGPIGFGLNMKLFREVVQNLPEGSVSFTISESEALLQAKKCSFKLRLVENITAFPTPAKHLSAQPFATLDIEKLLEGFNKVVFCHDDTRPEARFRSVCINREHIVSTDGFRLSYVPNEAVAINEGAALLLPTVSVEKLLKVYDKVTGPAGIGGDGGSMLLHAGGVYTSSRLIAESYPVYKTVLPRTEGTPCEVDRRELIDSLKRVQALKGDKDTDVVKLSFGPSGLGVASTLSGGDSEDLVTAATGAAGAINLNGVHLLKALTRMSPDKVTIEWRGPTAPFIITDGSHVNALQPTRKG